MYAWKSYRIPGRIGGKNTPKQAEAGPPVWGPPPTAVVQDLQSIVLERDLAASCS